eukprot:gene3617-8321_t
MQTHIHTLAHLGPHMQPLELPHILHFLERYYTHNLKTTTTQVPHFPTQYQVQVSGEDEGRIDVPRKQVCFSKHVERVLDGMQWQVSVGSCACGGQQLTAACTTPTFFCQLPVSCLRCSHTFLPLFLPLPGLLRVWHRFDSFLGDAAYPLNTSLLVGLTVGFVGVIAAGTAYVISIPAAIGALIAGIGGAYFFQVLFDRPVALDPKKKIPFPLELIEEISHDTKRFRFALQSKQHKLGLPVGQHMNLIAKVDEKTVIRPYTPVSSDDDLGYFDLIVKIYRRDVHPKFPEGGKMSQYLETLKIGDTIDVRGPAGHITYIGNGVFEFADKMKKTPPRRRKVTKVAMLAGGTGITPMLQIIKDILKHPRDRTEVYLIFANQTEEDILVRDELEAAAKDSRVHLWYTLDRPSDGWKYSSGYITEAMLSEHIPSAAEDVQVLICGPPPMIKFACLPNLEKIGYTPDMIATF